MSREILIQDRKNLRLNNVVSISLDKDNLGDQAHVVHIQAQLENSIKSKGRIPRGPIIQHFLCAGENEVQSAFLRQADCPLEKIEPPFSYTDVIKITNCLYARYTGSISFLQFAYDKLQIYAYEHNLKLKPENYTIFLAQEDDYGTIDIFMPRAEEVTETTVAEN